MPIYSFLCSKCGSRKEDVRSMKDALKPCICTCGAKMDRDLAVDLASIGGGEFRGPSYSPQVKLR